MSTINDLYKDPNIKLNLTTYVKEIFSTRDQDNREKMIKKLNDVLGFSEGEEGSFKAFDGLIKEFNGLKTEDEKKEFIQERVNAFLNKFGDKEVDPKSLDNTLSDSKIDSEKYKRMNSERKADANQNSNTQREKESAPENNSNNREWDSPYDRAMENLKKNNPKYYNLINSFPEDKREEYLSKFIQAGHISQDDIRGHAMAKEKPVEFKEDNRPVDSQDPNNFDNPTHSRIADYLNARARNKRNDQLFKEYQREKAVQEAQKDVQRGNIRRVDRGTSECVSKYADARVVQEQNIDEFNKECKRIPGFSDMSKQEQVAVLNKKIATDPNFKAVHDRVVRGYETLERYDDRMIAYLDDAKSNGVDVSRNAEEYDTLKNRKIEPAEAETDEIQKSRSSFEKMAKRIREAVAGLMNRLGFGKSSEPEVKTTASSGFSGPSNG